MGCASSTPAVADPVAGAFRFFPRVHMRSLHEAQAGCAVCTFIRGEEVLMGKRGISGVTFLQKSNTDARRTDASFPELVILPLYFD